MSCEASELRCTTVTTATNKTEIFNAIHDGDIKRLQELSLLPGGFGDARGLAWPSLLGVRQTDTLDSTDSVSNELRQGDRDFGLSDSWTQSPGSATPPSLNSSIFVGDSTTNEYTSSILNKHAEVNPHPDERQVQLDTDRSFVLYPVENHSLQNKKHLQHDLHDVILGVLRKRPKLRYFQGYHDIITVLFLTLPPESILPSAEKLSLHRVRDSMGSGLEPLIGQLRVLKRLLRLIDPSYAEILERNSPLPYYALSNLLTLFSHDMPTLPLVQHVFDWLLCREPVAAIWLAAAVILTRKEDILELEREGKEALGMMHAVLSALPALSETDMPSQEARPGRADLQHLSEAYGSSGKSPRDTEEVQRQEEDSTELLAASTNETNCAAPKVEELLATETQKHSQCSPAQEQGMADERIHDRASSPTSDSILNSWTVDSPRASSPPIVISPDDTGLEHTSEKITSDFRHSSGDKTDQEPEMNSSSEIDQFRRQTHPASRSRSQSRSLPGGYQEKVPVAPLSLSSLLHQASELLTAYPPSSPALRITETFGPQSALHPSGNVVPPALDDEEAEACVGGADVVFLPSEEEQDEESGLLRTPKEAERVPSRRKGRPSRFRLAEGALARRQTVVAGVVLLLGVAVALYGFGPGGRGAGKNFLGHGRLGNGEMRWVAAWMGGLLGVGQRLGVGL